VRPSGPTRFVCAQASRPSAEPHIHPVHLAGSVLERQSVEATGGDPAIQAGSGLRPARREASRSRDQKVRRLPWRQKRALVKRLAQLRSHLHARLVEIWPPRDAPGPPGIKLLSLAGDWRPRPRATRWETRRCFGAMARVVTTAWSEPAGAFSGLLEPRPRAREGFTADHRLENNI